MKMKKYLLMFATSALIAAGAAFSSCGKDDVEKPGPVENDTLKVTPEAGLNFVFDDENVVSVAIETSSTQTPTVKADDEWVVISDESKTGFKVGVEPYETDEERNRTSFIRVNVGNAPEETLKVVQSWNSEIPVEVTYEITVTADRSAYTGTLADKYNRVNNWSEGEQIGAFLVSRDSEENLNVKTATPITLGLTSGTGSQSAVFTANEVAEGDYFFVYPSEGAIVEVGSSEIWYNIPNVQTQNSADSYDHIITNSIWYSHNEEFFGEDNEEAEITFTNLTSVFELPIKLEYDGIEQLTIDRVILQSIDGNDIFPVRAGFIAGAEAVLRTDEGHSSLTIELPYTPVLNSTGIVVPFSLPMYRDLEEEMDVVISLNNGNYMTRIPALEATDAGSVTRLEEIIIDPLEIMGSPEIDSYEDWVAAVNFANNAGFADFIVTGDFTIGADSPFPNYPVFLSTKEGQKHTVSFDMSSAPYPTYNVITNGAKMKEFTLPVALSLTDVNLNIINGEKAILRSNNLTLNNSRVSGGFRISLTGNLVTNNSVIFDNTTVSFQTLNNNGTITNNGTLYYVNESSFEDVSGNEPQLAFQAPNSGFEEWYHHTKSSANIWYIASEWDWGTEPNGKDAPNRWWDSGNPGTGTAIAGGASPTSPSDTHYWSGGYSAKLASQQLTILYIIKKFAAGNIYSGYFESAVVTSKEQGAQMVFGREFNGALPVALTGYMDYSPGLVNWVDEKQSVQDYYDSFEINIGLATQAYTVKTTDTSSYPMYESDDAIIAYGTIDGSESTGGWQPFRVNLTYKDHLKGVVPTHIIITATASKNGNSFTGSTSSVLYVDDFNLEY